MSRRSTGLGSRRFFVGYATALLSMAAAWVVQILAADVLGREGPLLLGLGAVVISAWVGGLWPGLLATGLSALGGTIYLSRYSIHPTLLDELLPILLYVPLATATTWMIVARTRTAVELGQTTDTLETLIHASPLAILAYDCDGNITRWSAAAAEMFGYPANEVIGTKHPALAPESIERFEAGLRGALRGESAVNVDCVRRRADGRELHVSCSLAPLRDRSGKIRGAVGIEADITQRKTEDLERARLMLELREANESLRISEERYRLVSRVTNEAVWDWDILTDRIAWTRGLHRVFRYKPEQIQPTIEWHKARIHPDDRDRVLRGIEAAFSGGREAWSEEYRFQRGDNSYATVFDRGSIVRSDQGAPIRMIGSMLDITSLKDAERALQDSQRFLQRLVRMVPSLIVLTDARGNIVLFNRSCEDLTGQKRREVLGKSIPELFLDAEQGEAFRKRFADPFAPEVREAHEMPWRTRDGEHRLIEWRWAVLPPPDGGLPYLLGTGIDITERKRAEAEIHRAKDQAEQSARAALTANEAKNRFLSVLSHELRTPLAPVLMSSSVLRQRGDLPRDVRPEIEMIHRNLQVEVMLIDDLLDLTRIARGELRLTLQPTDAHEVLRHALDTCAADIRHKRLKLNLRLDAPRSRVIADATRLQQVFWNLLKNSVKFTPEGGTVTVRTGEERSESREHRAEVGEQRSGDETRLVVEITDTGVGIAPEDLQRLFHTFEHGPDLHEERGGLGLGLSIAQALARAQNGMVRAHSDGANKGATFTVELPLAAAGQESDQGVEPGDEATERRSDEGAAKPAAVCGPLRLLVVEDHEDTLRAMSRLLRSLGHHVATARDIQGALVAAGREEFDLVISDLALPDGSALDLMPELKRKHNLRGIALSGYGMDEDIRQTKAAGFERHLTKPVDFEQLQAAVEELCLMQRHEGTQPRRHGVGVEEQ